MKTWEYNDFHNKFGHHGNERLTAMATKFGYKLIGTAKPCDACSLVKSKAKSVPKTSSLKTLVVGERMGLDISGPFPLTSGKNNRPIQQKLYWYALSDYYSGKTLNTFKHSKDELVDFVTEAYNFMKTRHTPIKNLRMDNAGENQAVKQKCISEFGINVEFTPPDTPKLNGKVEQAFAVRWEKAKILMQNANLQDRVKCNTKILIHAISTAIFLSEEAPQKHTRLSSNDLFYGNDRKLRVKPHHFVEWGRIGFVSNKRSYVSKMKPRGVPMMFVGYALDHPSGTYKFYNPTTDSIITSDSVKWSAFIRWDAASGDDKLRNLFSSNHKQFINLSDSDNENDTPSSKDQPKSSSFANMSDLLDSDDVQDLPPVVPSSPPQSPRMTTRSQSSSGTTIQPPVSVTTSSNNPKLTRALKTLHTSPTYKVTGNTIPYHVFDKNDSSEVNLILTDDTFFELSSVGGMSDVIDDEDIFLDTYILHACIQSDPGEPTRWKDAFYGPEREWWIKSATSEFNNFLSRNAWKFVTRKSVYEKGRKVIPTKLVFKKKDEHDGSVRFKTRDVTLGYMMVPGVDYTERFSPVATDEALRLQISLTLLFYKSKGWRTMSCDIEAAFLESTMDVDMFIEPHPAMVVCGFMTESQRKESAIQLVKSMYGNVDAAIKFFKTLTNHLTCSEGMNMSQSKADSCVFYKFDDNGNLILMVSVTVDDCAITGNPKDIQRFMDGVATRFKITREGEITKHLGVEYEWGEDENKKMFCKATMNKKVIDIVNSYEEHTQTKVKEYDTPGTPNKNLIKNDQDIVNLDEFRSLVGKLMFFTTKVCPKIGAATRALSSHMSNPGVQHWNAMKRLVGYVKQMDLKGIKYVEPECLQVWALADTDYGNCRETRRSVGCIILTVGACIVDWWMAKHNTVSDSSCEAEYKELTKYAKGVKFLHSLLTEMKLIHLPGLIGEDNQGAIFLAENKQVNERTKYIDIKHHFIREFVEPKNGIQQGQIFKVDSKENTADTGTKNVEVGLFRKHEFELDNGMTDLREKILTK